MTESRTVLDYLRDIVDAADKAAEFAAGMLKPRMDQILSEVETAEARSTGQ
jgi:hypothetical protein